MQLVMGGLNKVWLRDLLTRSIGRTRSIVALVAYAQANHDLFDHCRRHNVELDFYGLLDEEGAVSPTLLADLLERGAHRVRCRLVLGHYHPKVVWWEGFGIYIGSANLTHAAWTRNVECGVFYPEAEATALGVADEIDRLVEYVAQHSHALTVEIVEKVAEAERAARALSEDRKRERERFQRAFANFPKHDGLSHVPAAGVRVNRRREAFMREWRETLQLLRDLAQEFGRIGLRPRWVHADADPTVHFDQFLHAYYYKFVRGAERDDEDDDVSTADMVERFHERNRSRRAEALAEAARQWAALDAAPYGEDDFIAREAPRMRELLSCASLRTMDERAFTEAMSSVNAFRVHARQQRNAFYGLAAQHHESTQARAARLAAWLWAQRSEGGRTVTEVLEHVLWDERVDMEQRLWDGVHDPAWRIEHLGRSSLGEIIGWARPDRYPPRNNRTNKALRALGHYITLFGD